MKSEPSLDSLEAVERALARQDAVLAAATSQLDVHGDVDFELSEDLLEPFQRACQVGGATFLSNTNMPLHGLRG